MYSLGPRASSRLLVAVCKRGAYRVIVLIKPSVLPGKSTALVVDSGATHTSAVPVLDGYALGAASVRSSLGGDHLGQQARALLNTLNVPLTPATHIQVGGYRQSNI